MATHTQLEEAKQTINQSIKEGKIDESEVRDLTDDEFVRYAQDILDNADFAYESRREEKMTNWP